MYNGFTSGFCAIVGFALCLFQIYCQIELTGLVDIVFWVYLAIFPLFYFMVYFGGNILYSSSNINFIKVFVLNSLVLYLIIAVNLMFIIIPFDDFADDYVVLGSIGVCSYLLSLMLYLKLLSSQEQPREQGPPVPKKPANMLSV
ncbi:MAG: hypothetical protein ABIN95_11680 [Mucilaginibacter sp.]